MSALGMFAAGVAGLCGIGAAWSISAEVRTRLRWARRRERRGRRL